MPVLHRAAHIQVLDADGVKSAREAGRELVQGVLADVGYARMQLGQPRLGPLAVLRAFALSGQAF